MVQQNGFHEKGNWYKGNIHCHTANSDGRLSQQEVARLYKEEGYHFLAFTDHNRFTVTDAYNDESFLVIPGIEVDIANHRPDRVSIYHAVGIQEKGIGSGISDGETFHAGKWEGIESAQSMINRLNEKGMKSVFCHPNWSRLELEDFIDLDGYFALEIYNYGCAVANHTGLSIDYWDSLLRRGRRIWAVATDDCHHRIDDRFGGWIMVKAPELTKDAILEALEEGSFYASSGPEIYDYRIENGIVHVECSPVRAIHFVTYEHWGQSVIAENNSTITKADHQLRGTEKYVRVECEDLSGRIAWSNPIFLK
jgi:hypothetical protein